jgi:periplasmic divalent cation tolerance protein
MKQEYAIVLTSTATEQQAREMARSIVEQRLAACVQIHAIDSFYPWKGELHEEPEWRLTIKTAARTCAELEQHIKAHHAYETPEIIQIKIAGGDERYLGWIGETAIGPSDLGI